LILLAYADICSLFDFSKMLRFVAFWRTSEPPCGALSCRPSFLYLPGVAASDVGGTVKKIALIAATIFVGASALADAGHLEIEELTQAGMFMADSAHGCTQGG
jgi:hypothetical protein